MSDQQSAAPASPAASAAQPPQTPQTPQQQTRMWNGRLERCKHCSPVYASLLDYRHANRFTDITVLLPKGHPPLQTIADSLGNFEDIVKAREDGRVAVRGHKLVLAIASGTLSHYFENAMDEAAEGDVVELDLDKVLPADPQHVAGAVLDWMYARQVHVHAGNVLGMLRAAEDLDVQDLLQLAKTILARFLAVDPALVLPSAAMAIPPRSVAGVRPRTASAAPPSARSSMYSDTAAAPAAPMQPQGQLRPVSYAGGPPQPVAMQPRAVAYPARPPPANSGGYGGAPHVAQLMGAVGGDRNSHDSHASFESSGNKRSSGIGKAFGKIFG
ncbi:hypothetical protein AMAG_16441 [Allomyces macrogynus ATCC 38327]|uniref:BTB domain-containing protein n=1 Tax=Allomyces macrogynus (strain ATCC 38327) TaxID=578462 RepID=A0A0L0TCQ6_ALLM3|nr:hypothetical protein AMAG_16441 [Allomyces macrogynus ATCC 38327]|eukprot:KNE72683.1 hypothetical protein AMAG_16441 [Allomyces macrogynus ATCC 38327]